MNVTATLFGQMITFAILIWFINRVLWEPLTRAMTERAGRIKEGLEAAEHGKEQEKVAEKHAKKTIREAKDRAAEIIANAQERSSEIMEGAKNDAREESRRILAAAQAEIEREINQAREQLRRDMAGLIVDGAGRVLRTEIDASRHDALLHDLTASF